MMNCQEYITGFDGSLLPCPKKALLLITYLSHNECISGAFCARHSMAIVRRERKGELEILSDEPVAEEVIPFQGEAAANPERTQVEYYGLESR